ncbi:MAG: S8 family serine peptidase [Pyrinomonadaceae bacterium]
MSSVISTEQFNPKSSIPSICQTCQRESSSALLSLKSLPEIEELIRANASTDVEYICDTCTRLFTRAQEELQKNPELFSQSQKALPTPLRLDTDDRFAGRGVTIAFLDSGFYSHPDLTLPRNRILTFQNIVGEGQLSLDQPDVASWHGMMTSVVAAGNGYLSNGVYRGIAPESNLVLVKIGSSGRIPEANIRYGVEWVLQHHEQFGIRVINISAGGDNVESYLHNRLSRTVEEAVKKGLTVVCAAGNSGSQADHPVLPPASAPSVITVGGLDDHNSLDRVRRGMYRSSYGPTCDGLQKPEVIAPGIWVAAPILPLTPTATEAEFYAALDVASDDEMTEIMEKYRGVDLSIDEARNLPGYLIRQLVSIKLREGNVINGHYKFVDGTSFAAPIVSSIIACMLEANPCLTPQQVKRILIDTAERLPHVAIDRQGWGVVVPRRAVEVACNSR